MPGSLVLSFAHYMYIGRTREQRGSIRPLPCVVSHVMYNMCRFFKATFLHPEKSISEELTSGEEVFVELLNKM